MFTFYFWICLYFVNSSMFRERSTSYRKVWLYTIYTIYQLCNGWVEVLSYYSVYIQTHNGTLICMAASCHVLTSALAWITVPHQSQIHKCTIFYRDRSLASLHKPFHWCYTTEGQRISQSRDMFRTCILIVLARVYSIDFPRQQTHYCWYSSMSGFFPTYNNICLDWSGNVYTRINCWS